MIAWQALHGSEAVNASMSSRLVRKVPSGGGVTPVDGSEGPGSTPPAANSVRPRRPRRKLEASWFPRWAHWRSSTRRRAMSPRSTLSKRSCSSPFLTDTHFEWELSRAHTARQQPSCRDAVRPDATHSDDNGSSAPPTQETLCARNQAARDQRTPGSRTTTSRSRASVPTKTRTLGVESR